MAKYLQPFGLLAAAALFSRPQRHEVCGRASSFSLMVQISNLDDTSLLIAPNLKESMNLKPKCAKFVTLQIISHTQHILLFALLLHYTWYEGLRFNHILCRGTNCRCSHSWEEVCTPHMFSNKLHSFISVVLYWWPWLSSSAGWNARKPSELYNSKYNFNRQLSFYGSKSL